jgi:hypothetical protein
MFTETQIIEACTVRGRVSSAALIEFLRANVPASFSVFTNDSERDSNAKRPRQCVSVYRVAGPFRVEMKIDFADRYYRINDHVREVARLLNRINNCAEAPATAS